MWKSLEVSDRLSHKWSCMLDIREEWREEARDEAPPASGSTLSGAKGSGFSLKTIGNI